MKSPFTLPWISTGQKNSVPEATAIEAKAASGFAIIAGDGIAHWSGRPYGGLHGRDS